MNLHSIFLPRISNFYYIPGFSISQCIISLVISSHGSLVATVSLAMWRSLLHQSLEGGGGELNQALPWSYDIIILLLEKETLLEWRKTFFGGHDCKCSVSPWQWKDAIWQWLQSRRGGGRDTMTRKGRAGGGREEEKEEILGQKGGGKEGIREIRKRREIKDKKDYNGQGRSRLEEEKNMRKEKY